MALVADAHRNRGARTRGSVRGIGTSSAATRGSSASPYRSPTTRVGGTRRRSRTGNFGPRPSRAACYESFPGLMFREGRARTHHANPHQPAAEIKFRTPHAARLRTLGSRHASTPGRSLPSPVRPSGASDRPRAPHAACARWRRRRRAFCAARQSVLACGRLPKNAAAGRRREENPLTRRRPYAAAAILTRPYPRAPPRSPRRSRCRRRW